MNEFKASKFTPAPADVLLAPMGEFPITGGPVQRVDKQACETMVETFRREGEPLLIDFEHGSVHEGGSSVAAGWIRELYANTAGLFAKVTWTDIGKKMLEAGRFRFLSPVWNASRILGNICRPIRLLSVGLTNTPNIETLPALTNSREGFQITLGQPTLFRPDFVDVYRMFNKGGMSRGQAVQAASEFAPELHRAWVDAGGGPL